MSTVGGPRRACAFASELEAWRPSLRFTIVLAVISGAKAYRKVPQA